MPPVSDYTTLALEHIRRLSLDIGGRGSCTAQERQACEYVAGQMRSLGLQEIAMQKFRPISSTYWPFVLAFSVALAGALAELFTGKRAIMGAAALLNLLGAWGMLAETDLAPNWTRWLLPKAQGQNVLGLIPPSGPARQRLVLCAHLDTHRTPIFYSSKVWQEVFSTLVSLAFASMAVGGLGFVLGAWLSLSWMRWLALAIIPIQAFALSLCLHADFTPFSPGANDDASGVGVILGLAKRLTEQPVSQTEVQLVFTDCEEVGAYGVSAYLDEAAVGLSQSALYLILDEVGLGYIKYNTSDGLVLKHPTHPRALQAARQAAAACPELGVEEGPGLAYTDALVATQRKLAALTICTLPSPEEENQSHWHQMTDTLETLSPQTLTNVHNFVWQMLQDFDQANG